MKCILIMSKKIAQLRFIRFVTVLEGIDLTTLGSSILHMKRNYPAKYWRRWTWGKSVTIYRDEKFLLLVDKTNVESINNVFNAPLEKEKKSNMDASVSLQHVQSLQSCQINPFDGNAKNWIQFRDMFKTVSIDQSNLPSIQKFTYSAQKCNS